MPPPARSSTVPQRDDLHKRVVATCHGFSNEDSIDRRRAHRLVAGRDPDTRVRISATRRRGGPRGNQGRATDADGQAEATAGFHAGTRYAFRDSDAHTTARD